MQISMMQAIYRYDYELEIPENKLNNLILENKNT